MEELFGQGKVALMDYIIAMHAKAYVVDAKLNVLLEMHLKTLIALNPDKAEEISKEFLELLNMKAEAAEKEFLEFGVKNMK